MTSVILIHKNNGKLDRVWDLFYSSDLDIDSILEKAFYETQNLEKAWHPNNIRSTSVGDFLVVDGKDVYEVAGVGFDKVGTL